MTTPPQPYTPHPKSLARRVVDYFLANPEEELSTADIATKFECGSTSIGRCLHDAVQAEALQRDRVGMSFFYCAGPHLAQAAQPAIPATPNKRHRPAQKLGRPKKAAAGPEAAKPADKSHSALAAEIEAAFAQIAENTQQLASAWARISVEMGKITAPSQAGSEPLIGKRDSTC